MSGRGQAEARAVTGVAVLMAASVAVGAVFPIVEQVLNTVFTVVGVVVGGGVVAVVVRDVFL